MRTFDASLALLVVLAASCETGVVAGRAAVKPPTPGYLYPAKGVPAAALKSGNRVTVKKHDEYWSFAPAGKAGPAALLFFPGGGVEPTAYAPLARALAAKGVPVYLVNLPAKRAAPAEHIKSAIAVGKTVMKGLPAVKRWVVGGHSMGGAVAAEFVGQQPKQFRGLILIGTTHPRRVDLSSYAGDVTKVYGTEDGVAKLAQSKANRRLLPEKTTRVAIDGGNHAQFGHYGAQFGDGKATISCDKQQELTVAAVVKAMKRATGGK